MPLTLNESKNTISYDSNNIIIERNNMERSNWFRLIIRRLISGNNNVNPINEDKDVDNFKNENDRYNNDYKSIFILPDLKLKDEECDEENNDDRKQMYKEKLEKTKDIERIKNKNIKTIEPHSENPRLKSMYQRFLLKEVARHLEEIKAQNHIINNHHDWNKQDQDEFWCQISCLREEWTEPEQLPMTTRHEGIMRRSTCVSLGKSVRFENMDF